MRQNDPKESAFRELLLRLREGKSAASDLEMLNSRNAENMSPDMLYPFDDSIRLVGTNAEASIANR
jgi:hypothetical protein